jgi:rhodanese-related sulfurtransferase/mannose-6-phosphate isomerase-like protein (cupin superfamily)
LCTIKGFSMAGITRHTETAGAGLAAADQLQTISQTPAQLADIVETFASSNDWMERVRLRADQRWYERLYNGPDYDVWVISWMPGQSTGFHDHGDSSGAFVVVTGALEESLTHGRARAIPAHKPHTFGAGYAHDVRNISLAPAISIHAYSPPLTEMNEYDLEAGRLIPRSSAPSKSDVLRQDLHLDKSERANQIDDVARIDRMLEAARGRLNRLSPNDALLAAVNAKAVLVDIRPAAQRAIEGSIEGALIVERNVLEWRFDPTSNARLPIAIGHDLQVIVFCSEGYTSSLAAASLQDLGLWRATDIIGGFSAWRTIGLPTAPPNKTASQ